MSGRQRPAAAAALVQRDPTNPSVKIISSVSLLSFNALLRIAREYKRQNSDRIEAGSAHQPCGLPQGGYSITTPLALPVLASNAVQF